MEIVTKPPQLKYMLKISELNTKRKLKNGDYLNNIYYISTLPTDIYNFLNRPSYLYFWTENSITYFSNKPPANTNNKILRLTCKKTRQFSVSKRLFKPYSNCKLQMIFDFEEYTNHHRIQIQLI